MKQPEALRLANLIESDFDPDDMAEFEFDNINRELRRLHEVNQELLEAAKEARDYLESWKDLSGGLAYRMLGRAIDKAGAA